MKNNAPKFSNKKKPSIRRLAFFIVDKLLCSKQLLDLLFRNRTGYNLA
jgi:hypothetical protein